MQGGKLPSPHPSCFFLLRKKNNTVLCCCGKTTFPIEYRRRRRRPKVSWGEALSSNVTRSNENSPKGYLPLAA